MDHPDFGKSFPCPTCYQHEHEQKQIEKLIVGSGVTLHHELSFDDFFALPEHMQIGKEDAVQACYDLAVYGIVSISDVAKNGVLLYGDYGVGKTTIGTSGLVECARRGKAIMRIKSYDYIDKVQKGYKPKDGEPNSDEIMEVAKKAANLLLDDLGTPKPGFVETNDKVRILQTTLEYRLEYNLPTTITSNLMSHKEIEDQFGKRLAERVRELCHRVLVSGEGLRR